MVGRQDEVANHGVRVSVRLRVRHAGVEVLPPVGLVLQLVDHHVVEEPDHPPLAVEPAVVEPQLVLDLDAHVLHVRGGRARRRGLLDGPHVTLQDVVVYPERAEPYACPRPAAAAGGPPASPGAAAGVSAGPRVVVGSLCGRTDGFLRHPGGGVRLVYLHIGTSVIYPSRRHYRIPKCES